MHKFAFFFSAHIFERCATNFERITIIKVDDADDLFNVICKFLDFSIGLYYEITKDNIVLENTV